MCVECNTPYPAVVPLAPGDLAPAGRQHRSTTEQLQKQQLASCCYCSLGRCGTAATAACSLCCTAILRRPLAEPGTRSVREGRGRVILMARLRQTSCGVPAAAAAAAAAASDAGDDADAAAAAPADAAAAAATAHSYTQGPRRRAPLPCIAPVLHAVPGDQIILPASGDQLAVPAPAAAQQRTIVALHRPREAAVA